MHEEIVTTWGEFAFSKLTPSRIGPPSDEEGDYALPIWAGVVPVQQTFGTAQDDGKLKDGIDLPPSVVNLLGATP